MKDINCAGSQIAALTTPRSAVSDAAFSSNTNCVTDDYWNCKKERKLLSCHLLACYFQSKLRFELP